MRAASEKGWSKAEYLIIRRHERRAGSLFDIGAAMENIGTAASCAAERSDVKLRLSQLADRLGKRSGKGCSGFQTLVSHILKSVHNFL